MQAMLSLTCSDTQLPSPRQMPPGQPQRAHQHGYLTLASVSFHLFVPLLWEFLYHLANAFAVLHYSLIRSLPSLEHTRFFIRCECSISVSFQYTFTASNLEPSVLTYHPTICRMRWCYFSNLRCSVIIYISAD
jgi:hypothetical protein